MTTKSSIRTIVKLHYVRFLHWSNQKPLVVLHCLLVYFIPKVSNNVECREMQNFLTTWKMPGNVVMSTLLSVFAFCLMLKQWQKCEIGLVMVAFYQAAYVKTTTIMPRSDLTLSMWNLFGSATKNGRKRFLHLLLAFVCVWLKVNGAKSQIWPVHKTSCHPWMLLVKPVKMELKVKTTSLTPPIIPRSFSDIKLCICYCFATSKKNCILCL